MNFQDHLTRQSYSDHTLAAYARDVRLFGEWYAQSNGTALTPALLTKWDVSDWKREVRGTLAPATINRRVEALRAWCAWANAEGLLNGDPLAGLEREAEQAKPPKWLERTEQGRVFKACDIQANGTSGWAHVAALRDRAIVTLLRNTGLRVAELCALELGDMTLPERGTGEVLVRMGKGAKRRSVDLNRDAINALREWLSARPNVSTPAVFVGKRGEALQVRGVQRQLEKHGITPHELRHTFAHELVATGTDLETARQLLGHADVRTTIAYAKPGADERRRAVERING